MDIPYNYQNNLFELVPVDDITDLCGGKDTSPEEDNHIVKIINNACGIPDDEIVGPPVKTVRRCSIMEFTRVVVEIGKYLETIDDLSKIIKNTAFGGPANTSEIALDWIKSGKIDAVIDRGVEKVLFSTLIVNPQWVDQLTRYNIRRNESITSNMSRLLN